MTNIDSCLIYILALSMACNIRFGSIGLQDFFVVMIYIGLLICGIKKMNVGCVSINFFLMFFIPIVFLCFCIAIKVAFYNERIVFGSVSLIIKLVMIIFYWNVFNTLDYKKVNYNFLLFIFSIPLIVSILMYYNPEFNRLVLTFYGKTGYPVKGRFGGMYGRDVNTIGLYATLVIILASFFYKQNVISKIMAIGNLIISSVIIVLSGMRAGIIAILITLIIMSCIRYGSNGWIVLIRGGTKKILKIVLILILIAVIFYAVTEYVLPDNKGVIFQERFALGHLAEDFKPDGEGNLASAMGYLKRQLAKCQNSSILFGYDLSFSFVDCFYIDIFFRYGIVGSISVVAFFVCCTIKAGRLKYRNYVLFLILFAIIISIKGIFVLDTKLIFIYIFLLNFLDAFETSWRAQVR